MAIEVVLMIPVLFMFALLVVAGGRFVSVRADVEAAARDGARAASYERTSGEAAQAARGAVSSQLDPFWSCQAASLEGQFEAGAVVEVTVDCDVPVDDLGLLGLSGSVSIKATRSAPLDTYRRTG